jgi:8-oxo-dGTP pyrophosphatase MutT (NUDIX family)
MTERTARAAARLVILEPDGAIYLQLHNDVEIGLHWAPPGGGIEAGETEIEAAVRETAEETGWTNVKVGPTLCRWEHDYTREGVPTRQSETIFLAAGPRRDLEGDLTESHQVDGILATRWWTPGALAESKALFWPPNLPELVARVRREGAPGKPLELGYTPNPEKPEPAGS